MRVHRCFRGDRGDVWRWLMSDLISNHVCGGDSGGRGAFRLRVEFGAPSVSCRDVLMRSKPSLFFHHTHARAL